jgi:hypothetical protein
VPVSTPDFIFHTSQFAGGIMVTTENLCQESRSVGQELSQGPQEYETRMTSIQPPRVIGTRNRTGIHIQLFIIITINTTLFNLQFIYVLQI